MVRRPTITVPHITTYSNTSIDLSGGKAGVYPVVVIDSSEINQISQIPGG